MKKIDLSNIEEAQSGNKKVKDLPAGGYICGIKKITDYPDKEYLMIEYDIVQGEYKNYFANMQKELGWADNRFVKSYKDSALPFFKAFITSVEKSNKNFKYDGEHEKTMENKFIGLTVGNEEYQKQNGNVGTRHYVDKTHSVQAIKNGDFTVPENKKLSGETVRVAAQSKPEPVFEDLFSDNAAPTEEDNDDFPF